MSQQTRNKSGELLGLLTPEQRASLRVKASPDSARGRSDIAIIGLSGKYPASDDYHEFWSKLRHGFNFIQEVPRSRWDHDQYFQPGMGRNFEAHRTRCRFGAFIDSHDSFDAEFFNIPPEEVLIMDPQERLALETTWSCIEDAGYVPSQLGAPVGIFSGLTYSDYQKLIPFSTHLCMLNSRIAWFFNFRGPTVTCDAGCSSSLSAIHLACENLREGNCGTAVVVGANLLLHPDHYATASPQLSATLTPRSSPFGNDDGWLPAEAVISLLLKPLRDAVSDSDHIYAVIKSTHISQEGKTSWFTAPSPKRQASHIATNFAKAGISPDTVSYVEAAANGSALGDAIEVQGLTEAFAQYTGRKEYCPLGSVKANVGHAEAASTLVQLTKVLLQFRSMTLIPNIHLEDTNPNIALENTPFHFQTGLTPWEPPRLEVNGREFALPRRATISSFGAGGNLGHLILEEHPFVAPRTGVPETCYLPISASSPEQLRELVAKHEQFFDSYRQLDADGEARYALLNVMFTLCIGRASQSERVVFVAKELLEFRSRLCDFLAGVSHEGILTCGSESHAARKRNSSRRDAWGELAEYWVAGQEADWKPFFEGYSPRRVSLPTFRFRKRRFPVPAPGGPVLPAPAAARTAQDVLPAGPSGIAGFESRFRKIFSQCLGVPFNDIDLEAPLDRYGFDSLMVVRLAKALEAYVPAVPKTLFFECGTLAEVIEYFERKYSAELLASSSASEAIGPETAVPANGQPEPRRRDIAIIGVAGRYPGAKNIREFWRNLRAGQDSITEVPADRWAWSEYFCPDRKEAAATGKSYCKWGGFIDDIDKFDAMFFGITPREAELMDPQERVFLEVAWSAIEDAGYSPASLRESTGGKVGVFAGVSWQEYQAFSGSGSAGETTYFLNHAGTIANRVSWLCNFEGISLTTDTACSSALTAIHLACASLLDGSGKVALAGGVNLSLRPDKYVALSSVGMISDKGRCESFGEGAGGYAPAEGVGCVLLKPLEAAVADGDHIYGIVRGTAVSHGGRTNGYSVPNPHAQARVVDEAIRAADIDPRTIGCIEAHGTGTSLGDPIEVEGLTKAFAAYTADRQYCAIGSVKSNIGHAESAAGIAGLTKALLQLRRREIVPSLHAERLNAEIDFSQTPFYVQRELSPWKRMVVNGQEVPRRIGLSSFGAGGANAHVILEEYISPSGIEPSTTTPGHPALIVLSAKTADRLDEAVRNLCAYLHEERSDISLESLAYTLQVGRQAMPERLALAVDSVAALIAGLEQFLAAEPGGECVYRSRAARESGGRADALAHAWDRWRSDGSGDELLRLWVEGVEVDWKELYGGFRPHRMSVPAYPFARERHWIGGNNGRPIASAAVTPPSNIGVLLCEQVWQKRPSTRHGVADDEYEDRLVLLCDIAAPAQMSGWICRSFARDGRPFRESFEEYASGALAEIQHLVRNTGRRRLIQVVVPSAGEDRLCRALLGLLNTARLEDPKCAGQLIEVDPLIEASELEAALLGSGASPDDVHIRYQDGERLVGAWQERTPPAAAGIPWKDRGVYLITGGAGGLGLIVAREIARNTQSARLILAGRSDAGAGISEQLSEISAAGASVEYVRLDVSDAARVNEVVEDIVRRYGSVNGIIHSAGVLRDSLIINKTAKHFLQVLAPKVSGTLHLDAATRDLSLDFFLLFSSVAGALGNAGQADYATANAFLDAFAEYRNHLVATTARRGVTLAINWPLWESGGMMVDQAARKRMAEVSGLMSIGTRDGLAALQAAMGLGRSQVMVLFGDLAKIRAKLSEQARPKVRTGPTSQTPAADLADEMLLERVQDRVRALFSAVSRIPTDRIDPSEPLESYGIDSILITRVMRELEQVFGTVSQTLFFECKTLAQAADHLVSQHTQECRSWTGVPERRVPVAERAIATAGAGSIRCQPVAVGAGEPVAIIGLSGRYGGADTLDAFWRNLREGRSAVTEIPADRWPMEGFYVPDPREATERGVSYSKWGSFLDSFADFDPLFFHISPVEAMSMDPQERLFLQAAWEAFEDAGYTRESLAAKFEGKVGVFAGVTKTGFDLLRLGTSAAQGAARPRTSFSSVANRVSYLMNLRGPSMPVDTMCSSSLTAIHEACEHLRRRECAMALAGGVNLYLHQTNYFDLCGHQMLSPDGRCRSFGAGANGFVPGEGVGAVLLKPLSAALADRDPIHAVIRATSVNHGGKTNGYTVPNPKAQAELIRSALDKAGIHARMVSCIEAHGTGTDLGDPIEVAGLTEAFRHDTPESGFCALGSVKSNLGHLEAAAGIAGVTKVILQMKNKTLAPTLHASELNPKIRFADTPFVVQRELADWKQPVVELGGEITTGPRIAGVSSFGAGGANAHVILEEHMTDEETGSPSGHPALIVLSARNTERLRALCENLHHWLTGHSVDLLDIAYTLQTGREAMEERLAFLVQSREELLSTLRACAQQQDGPVPVHWGSAQRRPDTLALLSGDADMAATVRAWVAKGHYTRLLKLWVEGLGFDWDLLYGESKPRRVSLPPYAFAKQRFWLLDTAAGQLRPTVPALAAESPDQDLRGRVLKQVRAMLAELIQLQAERIDALEPLHRYGVDSVIAARLTQALSSHFGTLPQTLAYEYPTVAAIAGYLSSEHTDSCQRWTGWTADVVPAPAVPVMVPRAPAIVPPLNAVREPVAIVGMSGRFAQSESLLEFWANLVEARDCITEIPRERWSLDERFFHSDPQRAAEGGRSYGKWGGFLASVDEFDPLFFQISPREAVEMDPHERLFLQECWRALEDAGYASSRIEARLRSRFGVYGGITQTGENVSAASLVNRVSHALDLHGPSVPVDTMCSSSLVALHLACESLRRNEIDAALVGAVNLYVRPAAYLRLSRARMLSQTARPAVFGQGGMGFTPSEGVGAVVIRRLSDAERDRDNILAVIRGTAVNHNGKATAYTVPNPRQQGEVIRRALEDAQVDPRTIGYVECAASGSEMGDAIELAALSAVFRPHRSSDAGNFRMGSLKATLGHGEAVSGMAQLMKVVLQLRHGQLCPTPAPEASNPAVDFAALPFSLQIGASPWPQLMIDGQAASRRAGITSMGAGGVNAHLIVEEYPAAARGSAPDAGPQIVVLSARTARALDDYLLAWKRCLETHSQLDLAAAAYTLQSGREAMRHRFACVVSNASDLLACFDSALAADAGSSRWIRGEVTDEVAANQEVQAMVMNRDLHKIARAWVAGTAIPWEALHPHGRLSPPHGLPTYPFARKSYRDVQIHEPTAIASGPKTRFVPISDEKLEASRSAVRPPPATRLPVLPVNGQRNGPGHIELATVRSAVRQVLTEVLYLDEQDELHDEDNFFELGLNSVTIISFMQTLNRRLKLDLRETLPFDRPSINSLSEYIVSAHRASVQSAGMR